MTATEELKKAIELVERAADILQKSQMAFDFNVGTPHHVAYTRTNASGTVSSISAKGSPKYQAGDTVIHRGGRHNDVMVEASKQSKSAAKDLKAELESEDFGMTEKGGNGRVKMGKDGTVSVYDSYYAGGDEALANHVKKWSPGGTYHSYFKDKGYNLDVAGTDKDHNSKVFGVKQGRLGHVAVHLKVTKSDNN